MRVSVFGLGYVGSVSAACLAQRGHDVIGVDTNPLKTDLILQGRSPIIEPQLDDLIRSAVNSNKLTATTDSEQAVLHSDISIICVGTPSNPNGSLDTRYLKNACASIGNVLTRKNSFHSVVVRSTLLPGTIRDIVIPSIERITNWKAGKDFGIAVNPEFMREGSAINDFDNPSRTIIGTHDPCTRERLTELYKDLPGKIFYCTPEIAEMSKYADNAFHAVKITFANEIGQLCKEFGIDSHALMELFCADNQLNISPRYLKPGFAFGGSCLPKDVRAITQHARTHDLETPLLQSLLPSNGEQIERGLRLITETGNKKIGILGFSFKAGTDDLRESPMVSVIEKLIGKGYDLRLYDRSVNIAKLIGANRDYIFNTIPHIEKLMVNDINTVLEHAQTIVIGNNAPEFHDISPTIKSNQQIVDFVRVPSLEGHPHYNGICW